MGGRVQRYKGHGVVQVKGLVGTRASWVQGGGGPEGRMVLG